MRTPLSCQFFPSSLTHLLDLHNICTPQHVYKIGIANMSIFLFTSLEHSLCLNIQWIAIHAHHFPLIQWDLLSLLYAHIMSQFITAIAIFHYQTHSFFLIAVTSQDWMGSCNRQSSLETCRVYLPTIWEMTSLHLNIIANSLQRIFKGIEEVYLPNKNLKNQFLKRISIGSLIF